MSDLCPKCASNLNLEPSANTQQEDVLFPSFWKTKPAYDINPYKLAKKLKVGYYSTMLCEGCGVCEIERLGRDEYKVSFDQTTHKEPLVMNLAEIRQMFSLSRRS